MIPTISVGATGAAGKEASDEGHETGREHQNMIVCKQSTLTCGMKASTNAVDIIVEFDGILVYKFLAICFQDML